MRHKNSLHGERAAVALPGRVKRLIQRFDGDDAGPGETGGVHVRHQNKGLLFRCFGKEKTHIGTDAEGGAQSLFPFFHRGIGGKLPFHVLAAEALTAPGEQDHGAAGLHGRQRVAQQLVKI